MAGEQGSLPNRVLDESYLEKLRELGGQPFVNKLIRSFISHSPERVKEMLESGKMEQWNQVERAAHSLKSSAGILGATELQKLATDIEEQARNGDSESLPELLLKLQDQFAMVVKNLRELDGEEDSCQPLP